MPYVALSVAVVVFFLALYAWVARYVVQTQARLPENAPADFVSRTLPALPAPRPRIVVCAGDSITHGMVSANYVDILASRFPSSACRFVNAGVNNELAYNLSLRLGPIAACEPDVVTVLIGTNDVNASFGFQNVFEYFADQDLPDRPSLEFYRENLQLIARRLKALTRARIAFLSLPTVGENLDTYRAIRVANYSAAIREVAREEGCDYLPLNERMTAYLATAPRLGPIPKDREAGRIAKRASLARILKGKSFDEISAGYGFLLHVDFLHLNDAGARMVAELVADYLETLPPPAGTR